MQLLDLTLHNYKVHRRKKITFNPGVVGIVGDNGSGKSSIISAICFLFTGEYDTPRKNMCITQGETEGWVKGTFRHNGKEGAIERHLSDPKVVLTYDGVTYNKFSEVTQLWNDLLQIDSAIFNNVIVAKQGEIQNLFSDETSVREKIFQKIFMVPPTEKIRSIIWENYIKLAPPEKSEEDILQLQTLQASVAHERNEILKAIDVKLEELCDETAIKGIYDKVVFLESCKVDLLKKPEIEASIVEFSSELEANKAKIREVSDYLAAQPSLSNLRQEREKQLANKPLYERRESLIKEIDKLEHSIYPDTVEEKTAQVTEIDAQKAKQLCVVSEFDYQLKQVVKDKAHLLSLRGHAICPTCYQEIPNSEEQIQRLMAQENELKAKVMQANADHSALSKQSQALWSSLTRLNQIRQRIDYLAEEQQKLIGINFDQLNFEELEKLIGSLSHLTEANEWYKNRQKEITSELRVLQERLNGLDIYKGDTDLDNELEIYRAAVAACEATKVEIADLQLQAGKLEHELLLLNRRIDLSGENHAYNHERHDYISRLEKVHDLFTVSKFPRKLIASYMEIVQTSLKAYLSYFNLPYRVKVVDGFKIRLFADGQEEPLPTVSGGQEMMVGICLRLALHKMFAQAFPIWIIDEGSTHLSESKKQNYFDLIDTLRKQKIINQIIVIDHDERLSTVVDQTIEL